MNNQEKIDNYNKYVQKLAEFNIPTDKISYIDENGNFAINELFESYTGKIIGDGVVFISIYDNPQDYMPGEKNDVIVERTGALEVHNIDGIDFVARVYERGAASSEVAYESRKDFKTYIENIYHQYNQILDEVKKGTDEKEIIEKFGLTSFSRGDSKKKSM